MSPHALPVPLGDYDLGNCNFRRANGLIEKSLRRWLWIISFELEIPSVPAIGKTTGYGRGRDFPLHFSRG
jgi:hypothetical protein